MKECSSDIESPRGLEINPSIASGIGRSLSFSCLTQLPSHNLQNPFGNERFGRTFSGWGNLGSNAAPEVGYAPVNTTADLTAAEDNANEQVFNSFTIACQHLQSGCLFIAFLDCKPVTFVCIINSVYSNR